MDYMNIGGDFLSYVDSGKKRNSNDYMSYIDQGMNFGDYTEKPKGKGRKGRPKISNNPYEFGIGLQAFGDSVMNAEISTGNAIRHGNKARKARKERYNEERQRKLKERGLKEGPTLGRKLYDELKSRNTKRKIKKQIMNPKYRHILQKEESKPDQSRKNESEEIQSQRYKNQEDLR